MKTPVRFILKVKLQWSFYRAVYLNCFLLLLSLTVYKSFTLKSVVAQSQYFWLPNTLLCFLSLSGFHNRILQSVSLELGRCSMRPIKWLHELGVHGPSHADNLWLHCCICHKLTAQLYLFLSGQIFQCKSLHTHCQVPLQNL